jgi:hypothetical protein
LPSPRICVSFSKMLIFYGDQLFATSPARSWRDHTLSAVSDSWLNTFGAAFVFPVYKSVMIVKCCMVWVWNLRERTQNESENGTL